MGALYLIRHPHTQPDPARAASEWDLSERGRQEVEALVAAPFWTAVTALYTSPQVKAAAVGWAVHAAHGIAWTPVEALAEAARDGWLGPEAFEAAQHDFFEQPDEPAAPDWEPAEEARVRFVTGIDEILRRHPVAQSVAVVAHATVLTLYEASLRGERATFEDWQRVGFAAVMAVDRATMQPLTPFLTAPYDALPG